MAAARAPLRLPGASAGPSAAAARLPRRALQLPGAARPHACAGTVGTRCARLPTSRPLTGRPSPQPRATRLRPAVAASPEEGPDWHGSSGPVEDWHGCVPSAYDCEELCSVDDEAMPPPGYSPKEDSIKAVALGLSLWAATLALDAPVVAENAPLAMTALFCLGYAGIIFEETLAFNKAGVALVMAALLWTVRAVAAPGEQVLSGLEHNLGEVSQVIFFLLGAMTIVETIDAHQGFRTVTAAISTSSTRKLLWLVGGVTFFMSSILDNLTTTIVMVSLLRKLIPNPEQRRFFGAVVVVAANAGGAWTPIGDVTTTMLWINGQISTLPTMRDLLIPSLVSVAIPLALMTAFSSETQGELIGRPQEPEAAAAAAGGKLTARPAPAMAPRANLVLGVGLGSLMFAPVFKATTGLPPYLGMLAGLGALWMMTDAIHFGEETREPLRVSRALTRIDTQGVLFFLGILLSIASLDDAGLLQQLAVWLDSHVASQELVAGVIGLVSAVIDNVPLVAATMGMYDMAAHPMDDQLWQLIAYCAGTGGSILIIGSAAGVAFMGQERVSFGWYFRRVTPYALVGYLAGIGAYGAEHGLLPSVAPVMDMLTGGQ